MAKSTPRPGSWGRPGKAGTRYVRTPEGAEKYGLPIGAPITADAIARAKARGRGYTVPEDDARFGSKPPAAGRTRRTSSEVVNSIRTGPAPRITTPDGPKKIAIGDKGFSFPEGSRAFRSKKYDNFAIVRTPDYQLVGITDRGIAFEFEGELERELNEELDDDRSAVWIPDEPNPNLGGAGAPEGDGPNVDSFRPDNLEDMPGYLSDERIEEISNGLRAAGLDENAVNAAELELRRNNERIEEEFGQADAPGGPDGTEPEDANAPRQPETESAPIPDRQPEQDATQSSPSARSDGKIGQHSDNIERRREAARPPVPSKPAAKAAAVREQRARDNKRTPDEQVADLEELSRSRPTGTAEGKINGRNVSVRRNRVNDSMEYASDNESFTDRESLLARTQSPPEPDEPRDTTDLEPSELGDQELEDVLADIDDALRAGMISRREARQRRKDLAAERERRGAEVPEEPAEREEPAAPEAVEGMPAPGESTTQDFADKARPGAAATTSDGLLVTRTENGWESPLGTVDKDFVGESDVESDVTVVTRNAPEADGRPVGATRKLNGIEDFENVRPSDSVVFANSAGTVLTGTRNQDGSFRLEMADGLSVDGIPAETLAGAGYDMWHVPNQDFQAPSKERWSVGDKLRSMGDLLAQKIGTRLRMRGNGRNERDEDLVVAGQGRVQTDDGIRLPGSSLKPALATNRVSITSVPETEMDESEIDPPRQISDAREYRRGDQISDYRHLRDMGPGQQVTLTVPASQNGGREAMVVLTRTRDEEDFGGFMFLVGDGGRGYNSFGENNASLFQAIHDGRLQFGNLRSGVSKVAKIEGADWNRDKTIEAWEGGPKVSEYDLRTFIASQVASRAMQGSYFNTDLLPEDSPFRSQAFRNAFAEKAIAAYSVEGNPARHKPAMIRFAAEKLGMEYTDPGSTLIPDNLTLEDFNRRVTLGRWLRSTGTSAEANMGPEQLDVTAADIKTALAVLDNMQQSDDQGDPDKILKRVFARQGSPLQDLNVAVAIASYFRMKRYKDGQNRPMTTIARQYDKRRNRELLRQMLREQLEGREPGYYGIPEDETYERNGQTFHNRSQLRAPAPDTSVAPATEEIVDAGAENDGVVEPEAPRTGTPMTITGNDLQEGDIVLQPYQGRDEPLRVPVTDLRFTAARAYTRSTWYSRTQQLNIERPGAEAPAADAPEAPAADAPEAPAADAPEASALQTRMDELDDFDNVRDAFMNARLRGDSVAYIREALGEDEIARMNSGGGSIRQSFTRAWNQRNGVAEADAPAAPEAPAERTFPMESSRRQELDQMSWEDAWRDAQAKNDVLNYIEDVMGPDGVSALNDGSVSMRAQFARAFEQANPDTYMTGRSTPAPATILTGETITADRVNDLPDGATLEYTRVTDGRTSTYARRDGQWRTQSGNVVDLATWNPRASFRVSNNGTGEIDPETEEATVDSRIGESFDSTELMSLPVGGYVRARTGTIWQLNGSYMTSVGSGTRRRIRNLRPGQYSFLGTNINNQPTVVNATPRQSGSLARAGLSRPDASVIERYDAPRSRPQVLFDTTDTRPWSEMSQAERNVALRLALQGALPEGSAIDVSAGPSMFSASYRTPDGKVGSMSRHINDERVYNAVAHAGGANFSAVQDHLFAFYRQHGITQVTVHGLSGQDWNGAHTWVRRGFRPDPSEEGVNFSNFTTLKNRLDAIIGRVDGGGLTQYREFLDEAKDLARRMTELLNERQNLAIDERNERLYRLWRELSYLGEVRDANGVTARGRRQSIGWLLLGDSSRTQHWYYGVRDLNDYFTD